MGDYKKEQFSSEEERKYFMEISEQFDKERNEKDKWEGCRSFRDTIYLLAIQ